VSIHLKDGSEPRKENPMSEKKRILVIDDEPDFCAIVQGNLEKEGYEVEVAYDGVQGLEKVRADPPDAIVLDVMMPEMDGYAVCKELKADEKYCDIPIIMLTAVASHVSSTRYSHYDGMSMEADDYLPKPASAEEITDSIKALLD
jgi:two-component system, OmpR family, alkaline phosphatase synthesis response regulator PhoP